MSNRGRQQPAHYTKKSMTCAPERPKYHQITVDRNAAGLFRSVTCSPSCALSARRHARHSGGARFDGNVGVCAGTGPAPGAGSEDAVLPSAKHSHVTEPGCDAPFARPTRAVGASALSGTDGTSTSVFDPAAATRVVQATVI